MTTTQKLSPAMREALSILAIGAQPGQRPGFNLGSSRTTAALERRDLIVHKPGTGEDAFALFQITTDGLAAIDRSMDEIVDLAYVQAYTEYYERAIDGAYCANFMYVMPPFGARLPLAEAWDEAVAEYSARCVSPTPEGGYNLMTEAPKPLTFRELLNRAKSAAVAAGYRAGARDYTTGHPDAGALFVELYRRLDKLKTSGCGPVPMLILDSSR